MGKIPTVALSEVRQAPGGAVRLDASPFLLDAGQLNAGNRALVQAGNALQGTAEILDRFAQQKQTQVNRGILANEENIRMQTASQIEEFTASNVDAPEKWAKFSSDTWKGYETARAKRQTQQQWGPQVRQIDDQAYTDYRTRTGVELNQRQNQAIIRQSNARLEANAVMKMGSGDENGAMAAINGMNLYADQRLAVAQRVTYQALLGTVNRDPQGLIAALEDKTPTGQPRQYKVLEDGQRYTLAQMARGAISQQRTDFQTDIAERRFAGELIGDSELKMAVAAGKVSPAWARGFQKQQLRDLGGDVPTDAQTTELVTLNNDISRFDPATASDGEYETLLRRTALLPKLYAADAHAKLTEKKEKTSPLNSPVAKDITQMNDENFAAGIYGNPKKKVKEGNKVVVQTDPVGLAMAQKARAVVQDHMDKFAKDNPQATREQALKEFNTVTRQYRRNSVWAPAIDPLTGKASP
jgi:hypothetical protein